jgi:hypothetical protein
MAADSVKEKVFITAKEAEKAPIRVAKIVTPSYSQRCLLCENTRKLPEGMHYCNTPWVCDECKEAIAFAKKQMDRDSLMHDCFD